MAPVGCVVVWRKMAYFGDTIAHTGLLGAALGLWLQLTPLFGMVLIGLIVVLLIKGKDWGHWFSQDTLLGLVAHTALSLGLVLAYTLPELRAKLMGFLVGDILSVGLYEALGLFSLAFLIEFLMRKMWPSLVAGSMHAEMAEVEGFQFFWVDRIFHVLVVLVIAVSIQLVGVLLTSSLLIIPAAASRVISQDPESMRIKAQMIAISAILVGLLLSFLYDLPTGPVMILTASSIFFGVVGFSAWRQWFISRKSFLP